MGWESFLHVAPHRNIKGSELMQCKMEIENKKFICKARFTH